MRVQGDAGVPTNDAGDAGSGVSISTPTLVTELTRRLRFSGEFRNALA
jgi:hypothetical protein